MIQYPCKLKLIGDKHMTEIIETKGNFTVTRWAGYYQLIHHTRGNDNKIADCRAEGGYISAFGSLDGWLQSLVKRESKRMEKIEQTIQDLTEEHRYRSDLRSRMQLTSEGKL